MSILVGRYGSSSKCLLPEYSSKADLWLVLPRRPVYDQHVLYQEGNGYEDGDHVHRQYAREFILWSHRSAHLL